jgi:hypothetical protein
MGTVTADGTTTKIYVDGVLAGSVAQGIGNWATGGFAIGAGVDGGGNISAGSDGFLGNFALLDIYNVALSAGDITTIYNDTETRFFPPITPVASYDFSDPACYPGTGNTVFDLTANNLDLPITNATFGGTGQSKYFEFNGSSSYIGLPSGVTGLGTSFSISIWSQSSSSAIQVLFVAGSDPPASSAPAFYYNLPTSGSISGSFNYGTGLIIEPFAINTWENYIYTADGTTAKLYKNGVLEGSVSQGAGNWPTGQFYLGFTTDALIGKIATFDVYNVVLNSGEVTDIYDNTENRFAPAPPPYAGILGGRQFAQGFNG